MRETDDIVSKVVDLVFETIGTATLDELCEPGVRECVAGKIGDKLYATLDEWKKS